MMMSRGLSFCQSSGIAHFFKPPRPPITLNVSVADLKSVVFQSWPSLLRHKWDLLSLSDQSTERFEDYWVCGEEKGRSHLSFVFLLRFEGAEEREEREVWWREFWRPRRNCCQGRRILWEQTPTSGCSHRRTPVGWAIAQDWILTELWEFEIGL